MTIHPDGATESTTIPDAVTLHNINSRGWNQVHVVVRGRDCQFSINGRLAAQFTDHHREYFDRGMIGLQLHDKGMQVEFRDLRLKEL